MYSESTVELELTCPSCNRTSHVIIATVTLREDAPVHCPACGNKIGTVGDLTMFEKPEVANP